MRADGRELHWRRDGEGAAMDGRGLGGRQDGEGVAMEEDWEGGEMGKGSGLPAASSSSSPPRSAGISPLRPPHLLVSLPRRASGLIEEMARGGK